MQRLNTLILDSETMDIDGIQFATGLRVLDISGHVEGLENLVYCSSLTTLEISYDDVITNLKGISLPQSLKTFKINHCSKLTTLDGLDTDSIPNLETFDASRNDVLSDISALQVAKLPKLSSADFENCHALRDITPLKGCTSLTYLNLEKVEITEESREEYRETIASLTGLNALHLPYCELTDEDTAMFAPLQNLKTLVLGVNNLTSTEFCKQLPKKIENLSLYSNDIQDASGLSGLTNLKILGLGSNQITDFTFAKNMKELTNETIRHAEGEEDSPFIETYYYNNREPIEIGADGTIALKNPYVDIDGNIISFQNAKVNISDLEESEAQVTLSEDGNTLTLSNVVPGEVTITATYKLPTQTSSSNPNPYKLGSLRITFEAVEKEQERYTISYDWGIDAPKGQTLPTDTMLYESPDAARAAIDQNFTSETTVKGEKDGKEGIWTFSGWQVTVDGFKVKATGSWRFAEHQHTWAAPTYTWSEDGKTCTAERVCAEDVSHIESETVNAAGKISTPATCTTKGQTTYTANFTSGWAETQTKVLEDVPVDADAHNWSAPTYTWSEDGKTCTAERVCTEDSSHVESETVNAAGKVTTPATCTAKGQTTYTATFTSSWAETQTKVLEDVEMIPHSYGTEWKTDAAGHWHACAICGEKKDEAAHSYEWIVDQEATDTQNGSKHQECSVCGYALNPVEIPQAEKPQTDPPQTEAPQTGDTHHPLLWLALCGVAAVGLGATFFVKKKQVN